MNLVYDLMCANMDHKEMRHAQEVMKDLGITYHHATPQSMGDCWQFWVCKDVPKDLPEYLTEVKTNPMQHVGYGLTKEMAEEIVKLNGVSE